MSQGTQKIGRRHIKSSEIKSAIQHLSQHPKLELCVPISVLGECVLICLKGEYENRSHNIKELHELIDFWGGLNVSVLHPNDVVAEIIHNLYTHPEYKEERLSPGDLVHLGYALAYDADYLITSDKTLSHYKVPEVFKLQIIPPGRISELL
ncbi:MAG TPA: PIN domain-containing protein [Methanothrix sp.]|nr:PIN domain-containing protein [Methanothrix sp.]